MFKGTFEDISEIASKKYDQKAKNELERQLNFYTSKYSAEEIKQLGLPQVLMFLSSTAAKSNKHKIIESSDVIEAFAFLRYILSRDFISKILDENSINIGLPLSEKLSTRFSDLIKIKGDMKTKNNLNGKVSRLISFLQEQKFNQKHINRIEIEIKATILLISRLIAVSRLKTDNKVLSSDIDTSYDLVRYLMFKLDNLHFKILRDLYQIDNEKIWNAFSSITFDQSTHDHLSSTAYARWESALPETFESLKKHINCSTRPFLGAIHGFCEIYGAKKSITRVGSEELLYILEDFEKTIFGNFNPIDAEERITDIVFTKSALDLLSSVSKWIQAIIIQRFGKDEYVFRFSSTIQRQISLLLFISIIEQIKSNDAKINTNHIATAINKWTKQLSLLILKKEQF